MKVTGMTDGELRALLQLRCVPGLGDRRLADLLRRLGSAEAVLALPAEHLSEQGHERVSRRTIGRVERTLRLIDVLDLELRAVHRPGYPAELLDLADAPVLLFARGDSGLLGRQSVAVVGTRRPTEYGISVTEQLVSGLARAGVVVWSGLARGIDSVAHRTALETGGPTVAVLGSGIDVPYPREHGPLLEEIARAGLVLSEFMPGEPPLPHHFPKRNRIIAQMATGVLVVEARPDGGALITADAGSGTRPIMAVPGPIGRVTSIGPNRLIQDGAKLVLDVADILEEIGGPLNVAAARGRPSARRHWRRSAPQELASSDPAQLVLAAEARRPVDASEGQQVASDAPGIPVPGDVGSLLRLSPDALHVDEIAARCGLGAGAALAQLLELEVAGVAEQVSGKRFRLSARPDPRRHALQRPGSN